MRLRRCDWQGHLGIRELEPAPSAGIDLSLRCSHCHICYLQCDPVNETTAGFAHLLLVLAIASNWGFLEGVLTAVVATLAFDFFFVPPILGFTVTNPQDWVA
jgi:K+-sensing histidine kinase KdpD